MRKITKDDILNREDTKLEQVDIPEWGISVHVRTLSGSERDLFESRISKDRVGIRGLFAALVVCDEKGDRVFSDADQFALGKKSAAALDRILDVGLRLNGMKEEAVAEMEKNSETGQNAASG